jgi:large subunit ribosomal protein L17
MRHLKTGRKFNRSASHRRALWRNMTTSLIVQERIRTTTEKAKELRHFAEKMVTIAKRARALGDGAANKDIAAKQLHLRRQALSFVRDEDAVKKLFDDLAARFADRPGGYTRIIRVGERIGDGAHVSLIEFLGANEEPRERKKAPAPKKRAKPKAKAAAAPADVVDAVIDAPADETPAEAPVPAEEPKTE